MTRRNHPLPVRERERDPGPKSGGWGKRQTQWTQGLILPLSLTLPSCLHRRGKIDSGTSPCCTSSCYISSRSSFLGPSGDTRVRTVPVTMSERVPTRYWFYTT